MVALRKKGDQREKEPNPAPALALTLLSSFSIRRKSDRGRKKGEESRLSLSAIFPACVRARVIKNQFLSAARLGCFRRSLSLYIYVHVYYRASTLAPLTRPATYSIEYLFIRLAARRSRRRSRRSAKGRPFLPIYFLVYTAAT